MVFFCIFNVSNCVAINKNKKINKKKNFHSSFKLLTKKDLSKRFSFYSFDFDFPLPLA